MTTEGTNTQGRDVHANSLLSTVILKDGWLTKKMQMQEQAFAEDRRQLEAWFRYGCCSVPGTILRG